MPTSNRGECCVPGAERARSFLRLVRDAPGVGRSRQRASDAAHAERLATLGREGREHEADAGPRPIAL
jgi:hypothetical protein